MSADATKTRLETEEAARAVQPRCGACGAASQTVRFHQSLSDCSWDSRAVRERRTGRHLHRKCRNCGFDWTEAL